MSNEKTLTAGSLVAELFRAGIYKRNQGRVARQVTCAVVWVVSALGAWRAWLTVDEASLQYLVGGAILFVGVWAGYRIVNIPQFADFLIAVEAEMNKVSWPAKSELIRSSAVVILVIFLLASILFGYDLLWQRIFFLIGVRY
ncbi:MAG: preprotein translocase subunit SecE [Planctomycetota bacterium]